MLEQPNPRCRALRFEQEAREARALSSQLASEALNALGRFDLPRWGQMAALFSLNYLEALSLERQARRLRGC